MRVLDIFVLCVLVVDHERSWTNGGDCVLESGCFNKMRQDNNDAKFKWVLAKSNTREIVDNAETGGKVLTATIAKNYERNEFAESVMPFKLSVSEQCIAFRYYMNDKNGCDVARLTVDAECGSSTVRLVQESGTTDNRWKMVTADIKGLVGTDCKVTLKAAKGLNEEGKIGIDQIATYKEPCPANGLSIPEIMICNFQTSLCDWKSTGDLEFKITEHRPYSATGPHEVFDRHVSHGVRGKYLLVVTVPENFKKEAKLESPAVFSKEKTCMRFVANMNGKDVNQLEVTLNGQKVVSEEGNKGEDWFEKWIDLPANRQNKVVFTIKTGDGPRGNIALDDIIVQRGDCQSNFELSSCEFSASAPCKYEQKQTPCTPTYAKANIDGRSASVLKMEHTECERKEFYVSWEIPEMLRTPRKSCLSFDYKVKIVEHRRCWLRVEIVGKRTHRIDDFDIYKEEGVWRKYKKTISRNLADYSKIRMTSKVEERHCKEYNFANIRLTSGPCA